MSKRQYYTDMFRTVEMGSELEIKEEWLELIDDDDDDDGEDDGDDDDDGQNDYDQNEFLFDDDDELSYSSLSTDSDVSDIDLDDEKYGDDDDDDDDESLLLNDSERKQLKREKLLALKRAEKREKKMAAKRLERRRQKLAEKNQVRRKKQRKKGKRRGTDGTRLRRRRAALASGRLRRLRDRTGIIQWLEKLYSYAITEQTWLFLLGLGLLSAVVGLGIDFCISSTFQLGVWLTTRTSLVSVNYVLWILYALPWCALSLTTVLYISPYAAGSGIPEMKSILSGIVSDQYLSFRTLVAKVVGLIAGFAGGLSIGKGMFAKVERAREREEEKLTNIFPLLEEGPFVHISSILANLMMRLRIFRRIRQNDAVKLGVLAASCAVGVSTAFGAPVGGVLFSVEVTSTYYFVENLWKSIFCAVSSWLIVQMLGSQGLVEMFRDPEPAHSTTALELGAFVVLGALGGVLGSFIVKMLSGLLKLGLLPPFTGKNWQYLRVLAVGLIVALITFPFPQLRNDSRSVIAYVLSDDSLVDEWPVLVALLLLKLIMTVLSVGFTGIPCGIYTPLFIMGAIFGRLCGEVFISVVPALDHHPTSYAIVGAAALGAGATRTISTAVIVIELTGQVQLLLPILVAVLLSTAVGRFLSLSVYDVLVLQKGLPIMPTFRLQRSYNKTARDIMRQGLSFLSLDSTFVDVRNVLRGCDDILFPLVEDLDNKVFLGTVRRAALEDMLNEILLDDPSYRHVDGVGAGAADAPIVTVASAASSTSDDDDDDQAASQANESSSRIDQDIANMSPVPPVMSLRRQSHIGPLAHFHGLETPVPYVFTAGNRAPPDGSIAVDTTEFQIDEQTSLYKVHYIFTMLGVSNTYVTCRSRLVGEIDKHDLINLNLDQFT
jgi:chloride channel 2